mgnify:CR=1 FL=1
MISNYWEEQGMDKSIEGYHENMMSKMQLPKWMNVKCPFCNKPLPLRSIRSVGLKFNTRNIGDIVLEVLCTECSKMDTLYFREKIENINDFIAILQSNECPESEPLLEEEMYKKQYNNLVERMSEG